MFNNIQSNILPNYVIPFITSQPVAIAAGCLCAIPAVEMAVRAGEDVRDIWHLKKEDSAERKKLTNELIRHVAGALLLGGCALNIFPGSAFIGVVGFMIYSKWTWKKEQKVLSTIMTGVALTILWDFKKQMLMACGRGISKACTSTIHATAKLSKAVMSGATAVGKGVSHAVKVTGKVFSKVAAVPLKIGKVVARVFSHPKILIGVVAGAVCLAVGIQNAHLVSGVAHAVAYVAKGIFSAGIKVLGFIPQVLSGTIKAIGTVLGFVPTILSKILAVIKFILRI